MPSCWIARALATGSFALVLVGQAVAGPFADFRRDLQGAQGEAEVLRVVTTYQGLWSLTPELEAVATRLQENPDSPTAKKRLLERLTKLESIPKAPQKEEAWIKRAEAIKQQPLYRDPEPGQRSNWIGRALERLTFDPNCRCRRRETDTNLDVPNAGSLLTFIAWIVLGLAVAAGIFFAVREFGGFSPRRRALKALLEDDEPERTAPEWIENARGLAAQGKYREAVRSLYLACLVEFDNANVARFIRGETNWEHLHRIHASPRRPTEIDFLEPTQRFDRIWYGYKTQGQLDFDYFMEVYERVCRILSQRPAA